MDETRVPAPRRPGFRFSATDAAAIALGGLLTWLSRERLGPHALLVPFVLAHFFLFCNVFRVRRSYELAWAGLFMANYAGWTVSGAFTWLGVLGIQAPVTILAIALEMRSPSYHGVLHDRIRRPRGERSGPGVDVVRPVAEERPRQSS